MRYPLCQQPQVVTEDFEELEVGVCRIALDRAEVRGAVEVDVVVGWVGDRAEHSADHDGKVEVFREGADLFLVRRDLGVFARVDRGENGVVVLSLHPVGAGGGGFGSSCGHFVGFLFGWLGCCLCGCYARGLGSK